MSGGFIDILQPLISLVVVLLALAAAGRASVWISRQLEKPTDRAALVEQINRLLPQTQCGQCGYAGCSPYADAIAHGQALNRCPPGGALTIRKLAALTARPALPLDTRHGWHLPDRVAVIREAECIGCTKCIQACPVDAIVGAPKRMHTVIASDCTGCDLCVDPCPVDCIDMLPLSSPLSLPRTSSPALPASVIKHRSSL